MQTGRISKFHVELQHSVERLLVDQSRKSDGNLCHIHSSKIAGFLGIWRTELDSVGSLSTPIQQKLGWQFPKNFCLLLMLVVSLEVSFVHAGDTDPKFVPPKGKCLIIIGQDKPAVDAYERQVGLQPAGVMTYDHISSLALREASMLRKAYPQAVIQIGLEFKGVLKDISAGKFDANIEKLAQWALAHPAPIFLRPGYECDGAHNNYAPADYVDAFRYLHDKLDGRGVENIAYVWHVLPGDQPIEKWWPGERYVDWVGITYFDKRPVGMGAVAAWAKKHEKPLMIAEGAPRGIGTIQGKKSWDEWFQPCFEDIATHDVRALCYINWDWEAYDMFRGGGWGDTRIQQNRYVNDKWIKEISKDKYLTAPEGLFQTLGWHGSDAPADPASSNDRNRPQLVEVTELNKGTEFPAPWVTGDGLTVYWENPRGTIWTAKRESPDSPFGPHHQILSGLHPTATDDGLEIIFLGANSNGKSGRTLQISTRESTDRPFGTPTEIRELLTPGLVPKNPALSNDGLALYFNLTDERKKEVTSTLQFATRRTRTAPWNKPRPVPFAGQVKSGNLAWVSVTPDGLLLFCCHEGGNSDRQVTGNLMLSRRANLNQPFPQPKAIQVDDLPPLFGRSPRYVPATKELFFARGMGDKKFGIWVVKRFDASEQ